MTTRLPATSPLTLARLAGFLYLLVVPLGIIGTLYIPSLLVVRGNAAATAANLAASASLYRLGIVLDMLAPLLLLVVVLLLYILLKPVHKSIAQLMVMLVVVGASISLLNKVNQFAAVTLAGAPDYLAVFTSEQLSALALFFLRLGNIGNDIAFIFWGFWLLPLGILVFRSGFFPRLLGILLVLSCAGYVVSSFAGLLGYSLEVGLYTAWGELIFILGLLVKGVNADKWRQRALEHG